MNWNTVLLDRFERIVGRNQNDSIEGYAVKQFGAKLGPLFYDLWRQLDEIEIAFGMYDSLFVSERNREILRKNNSIFWDYLSRFVSNYLLMSLSRITDAPNGNRNVTIKSLPTHFEDDSPKKAKIESYLEKIEAEISIIRKHRNKSIAHRDKSVHIDGNELPLVPFENIENSISLIKKVLREISHDDKWIVDKEDEFAYTTGDRFVRQLEYLAWVNKNYEKNLNEGIPMPPKKEFRQVNGD